MMQPIQAMSFLGCWSLLLCITLLAQSLPTFATPIDSRSLSLPSNYQAEEAPRPEILPQEHHDVALAPLSKRTFNTYYNNLGGWKMILTASSLILSQSETLVPHEEKLIKFLASVVAGAAARVAKGEREFNSYDFGLGAVSLAFTVRNDIQTSGGGPLTIPWSLVELCVKQFLNRAKAGNMAAFTGVVTGPLPGGPFGKPWIEVVLKVGGKVLMDGIPFSIE